MPQERILVVDDEESIRCVVAALLERSGYAATTIESAEEAIVRLQEDPGYDLVLSDIMMPGTDGLTLLDQICTDHPGMPVVMLSAMNDFHVVTNAFRRGAIDYLLKPFERAELESIVMRAIEHGRLRKQNTITGKTLNRLFQQERGGCARRCRTSSAATTSQSKRWATRSICATKRRRDTPGE
jgi:DNA-binding NtrC family response regulator